MSLSRLLATTSDADDLDVYKPERWVDDALFRPEVRSAFGRLMEQGWTDALRKLHPAERIYTFGIISATHGLGMPGCASIMSCSAPPGQTPACCRCRPRGARLGQGERSRTRMIEVGRKADTVTQPLLVIDGNFFAHRAYHAVPKTIRRAGNKGAGAMSPSPIFCFGSMKANGPCRPCPLGFLIPPLTGIERWKAIRPAASLTTSLSIS